MRLLNVYTLDFKDCPRDDERPLYAITSHRWIDEEITYQKFIESRTNLSLQQTAGYKKIQAFCDFVKHWRRDVDIVWIWIDTCCIDKTSNHELSEAINSMFRWYAEARVCIAYLHDVLPSTSSPSDVLQSFEDSVWFTRGWTLQELLAPMLVVFLDQQWGVLGHKAPSRVQALLAWESHSIRPFDAQEVRVPLNHWISTASGIPPQILADYSQSESLSIAEERQWMKRRMTTRTEDAAYCLLGICGVYMPLIYGEREFAFERLEDAIENKLRRKAASQSVTTADSESHAPRPPDPANTEDEDSASANGHRINGNNA